MIDYIPSDFLYEQEDNLGAGGVGLRSISTVPPTGTAKLLAKYVRSDIFDDQVEEINKTYKKGYNEGCVEGYDEGYQKGYEDGANNFWNKV